MASSVQGLSRTTRFLAPIVSSMASSQRLGGWAVKMSELSAKTANALGMSWNKGAALELAAVRAGVDNYVDLVDARQDCFAFIMNRSFGLPENLSNKFLIAARTQGLSMFELQSMFIPALPKEPRVAKGEKQTVIIIEGAEKSTTVEGIKANWMPVVSANSEGHLAQMGVGVFEMGSGKGYTWGLVGPHSLIQSYRAMKLLEAVPEGMLRKELLCHFWHAAEGSTPMRIEASVKEVDGIVGKETRERVLKMVPEDILSALEIMRKAEIKIDWFEMLGFLSLHKHSQGKQVLSFVAGMVASEYRQKQINKKEALPLQGSYISDPQEVTLYVIDNTMAKKVDRESVLSALRNIKDGALNFGIGRERGTTVTLDQGSQIWRLEYQISGSILHIIISDKELNFKDRLGLLLDRIKSHSFVDEKMIMEVLKNIPDTENQEQITLLNQNLDILLAMLEWGDIDTLQAANLLLGRSGNPRIIMPMLRKYIPGWIWTWIMNSLKTALTEVFETKPDIKSAFESEGSRFISFILSNLSGNSAEKAGYLVTAYIVWLNEHNAPLP